MNDFIYATTADNLRVLIEQANDEGWDLRTLRDRILLIYDQWINGNLDAEEDFGWFNRRAPVQRTTLISETESILTVSMAALALYQLLGIELVQWWTMLDERVCFPENTMVLTKNGERPIQNVKSGDFVKTRRGWNKVTGTSKRLYSGPMTSINTGNRSLSATSDHPVWKQEYGWLPICNFEIGDRVQTIDDELSEIIDIVDFRLSDYVYDLTIDGAHEFYANGILVHNCPWCGELHGTIVSTGQSWFSVGDVLDVSGAMLVFSRTVFSPPAHSRCRCFLLPYFG